MIITRAPLRIPLGGGGTDLPSYYKDHGGFIFSLAINKYVFINLNRPSVQDVIRVKYSKTEEVRQASEIQHPLVREALLLLGIEDRLEIAAMADVPAGTGLGSSGSFLVALLRALHAYQRDHISARQIAEEACEIEIERAGSPVGKQDQYVAALGGFLSLEIAPDGRVTVCRVPLAEHVIEDLRTNMLLFYTGLRRDSSDILNQQKRDTESGNPAVLESLHCAKQLGYQVRQALLAADLHRFGELLDEHWENKKRRAAAICNGFLDRCYQVAKRKGAIGGKLMGAGGGGFFLFLCHHDARQRVRQAMQEMGLSEMLFEFDREGAKVVFDA